MSKPIQSHRTFISPALLKAAEERRRLASHRDRAAAARSNLQNLIGETLADFDPAVGYLNQMYDAFKGVDNTEWAAVKRIHDSYRKLSLRFCRKLSEVGRGTAAIAPMLAGPLASTVVDLPVTGQEHRLSVTMTPDGFSVNVPTPKLKGWLEVGSYDGQFGIIWAFDGRVYTTQDGYNARDKVRVIVVSSPSADAKLFDDAIESDDGDTVLRLVAEMVATCTEAPKLLWDNVKAGRAMLERRIGKTKAAVIAGDAGAKRAVIASAGGDSEQAEMPKGAVVSATAMVNPVKAEEAVTSTSLTTFVGVAEDAAQHVDEAGVEAAAVDHDAELARLEKERLGHEAELAQLDKDEAEAKRRAAAAELDRVNAERDAEALRQLEAEEAAKTAAAAAAVVVAPKKARVTWYNTLGWESRRAVNCPGEGWVTSKAKADIVRSMRKPELVGKKKREFEATQAAVAAKAQDDAVASAVANDPAAAEAMAKIEAEKARRAAAAVEVHAEVMSADEVIGAAESKTIDATVVASSESVAAVATK